MRIEENCSIAVNQFFDEGINHLENVFSFC